MSYRSLSKGLNKWTQVFCLLLMTLVVKSVDAQITLRSSATTATGTASLTINKPLGVVVGDVMIANVANYLQNTQVSASCAGWTVIAGTDTDRGRATLLYKVAGASEPSSYTFTVTTGSTASTGAIVAFSGVNTTTPFDVTPATSWYTQSASSLTAVPSITTTAANAAVIMFGNVSRVTSSLNANYVSGSWSTTNLGNLTELYDVGFNNASNSPALGAAWAIDATPGATGNGSLNCNVNTNPRTMGAMMVALRAAVPSVTATASATSPCSGSSINLASALTGNIESRTIAFQGFETAGNTVTYAGSGGGVQSGFIATGDGPASSGYAKGGINGYAIANGTATVTLANVTGLTGYTNKRVYLNLATFSIGSTSNGADALDNVTVAISLNNGGSWSNELQITGASSNNAYWGYNTGNAVASTTYDGDNTSTVFSPAGSGLRTTDGYSELMVSIPDNATQVRVRITMLNNSSNEVWVIDDITIAGTPTPQYSWTSTPAGYTSSVANPNNVSVSTNTTYMVSVTDAAGLSVSSNVAVTPIPTVTPSVSIASNDADNIFCTGTSVTFTATPTNGGTTPSYQWRLNATNVGTNSTTYNNAALVDGDQVSVVMTSNATCVTTSTATSSVITNTVAPSNSVGAPSSNPTLCINTALTNITIATTGATGIGTATGLPAGVTAAWASNTITISGTPTASGTFNYTIPLTGGCGTVNATGTITVNPNRTAGTPSSNPTVCVNTALTNISIATTGATGIGTATGLPAGVTAVWASNTITISGTPTASGTFNYTIPLTGGCGTVNATGTITVNSNRTAGAPSSNPTVCVNTALTNITIATTGATGIGTATGLPAGVTAAWASNTITISGTPTSSGTFNYTIPLTGGCGTANASGTITVSAAPSISSPFTASACNGVIFNATPVNATNGIVPAGTTYTWSAPSGSGFSGGSSQGIGQSSISQTLNLTGSSSAIASYVVTPRSGSCVGSTFVANIAINPNPVVAINVDYCAVGGSAVLNATTGLTSYLWSDGSTSSSLTVQQADMYSVVVSNAQGCTSSATVNVASELVTNGNFNLGNTGFSTGYTYVTDAAGNTEMYPEGTYSVANNANNLHNAFFGTGFGGSGNFLIVNGAPSLTTIWSQNNIAIQPNTTYYFSAWGLTLVNGNNAALQFNINGAQVGSIAYLPNGTTTAPFPWTRFYGQWNSGNNTTVDLSIVNLQMALGGNDFGLDNISFGTFAPIGLSVSPIANGTGNACPGNELIIHANASGGYAPYTYSWSGPNGFTSTEANPLVSSSATSIVNGTYNLTVTDALGCANTSSSLISLSALPNAVTPSLTASSVCQGSSTNVSIPNSESSVGYTLYNATNNLPISSTIAGNGGALTISTGTLQSTTSIYVVAQRYSTGCSVQLTPTLTATILNTPVLVTNNITICSGTANLTSSAVTAGSTGGGTLTYWTNAAATLSVSNPASVTSGTYFIRSAVGSCVDIEPVTVVVTPTPVSTFTYSGSPFCSNASDPSPVFSGGGTPGVFSSSPGLVFVSTASGIIDLSASTAGTYTVTNTVTPNGACSPSTTSRTITITALPNPNFSYVSNGLCQSIGSNNPLPIFQSGAQAGTFSSSALSGLSFVSASTGEINLSASTPGSYPVINTINAIGGCPLVADTVWVDINPYTFAGAVNVSSSASEICPGQSVNFFASGSTYSTILERENFNGTISPWVATNLSTGGTATNARWRLRQSPYNYNGNDHISNDASQFYMSNSQDQGGGTTNTNLKSPQLNTIGFSTLELSFWHYYNDNNGGGDDFGRVQVSTNNTTWTTLTGGQYNSDQGTRTNFVNAVFNLNAYVGLPALWIRFQYDATNDRAWAIDNITISGNSNLYTYNWTSSPSGFVSDLQNPSNYQPSATAYYDVSIMNNYGCVINTTPIPVVVKPLNTVSSASSSPTICINSALTNITHSTTGATGIGSATGLPSGVTASWSANTITISGTPTVAGTFNYSIPITGGCGSMSATGTIVVNPATAVGSASSAPYVCVNTIMSNVTHTTTGATGIGTATGLPAGVSASFVSNTITISGAPTVSGTFNYSIPVLGTCGSVNATGIITVNIAPNAGILSGTQSLCSDGTVTFTSNGNTGGAWTSSNTAIATINGTTGAITPVAAGTATMTYTVTGTGGCSNATATRTVTVNQAVSPSVAVTSNDADNSICDGTSVTFTAAPTNGGTTPSYQWKLNGTNVGTNATTYTNTTLANNDVVTVVMTANNTCQTTATANGNNITTAVISNVTPGVAVTSNDADNSICAGTSVTFTATPTNGGTTPTYQWKLNGSNVGSNSATYTSSALANNDLVTVVMTANNTCQTTATANGNNITTAVIGNVTPGVAVTSNDADNSICDGTSVTFTAAPTNGGTTPSYQWKLNGTNVGTNATTYTNTTLANNAVVTVVMTANNTCQTTATANGNNITTSVIGNVTPGVAVTSNDADNSICAGTSVTFTATPTNGGTTPTYQWKLNGSNVGINAATYTNSALANNAVVTVVMTANNTCQTTATANGNNITTSVIGNVTPGVAVTSNDADNSICAGTSVTFTATPTNGGSTPTYQWKLNGSNVGTNAATYTSSALANNDLVTVVMTANNTCQTASSVNANSISTAVLSNVNYYIDQDGDTYGLTASLISTCIQPSGYTTESGDCDDNNADAYPFNLEICNASDDDCDGVVDNGISSYTFYADLDQDGYGSNTASVVSCDFVSGYIMSNGDCNDANANVNPLASELCSTSYDDDCDGLINESCNLSNDDPLFSNLIIPSLSLVNCNIVTGNLGGASPSGLVGQEVLTGNSPDVWYYFTANAQGVTIRCTPSNDVKLELRTGAGVLLKSADAVASIGDEYLNYGQLVVGGQYYVRVIQKDSPVVGGAFTLCTRRIAHNSNLNYTNTLVYDSGCDMVYATNTGGSTNCVISLTPISPAGGPVLTSNGAVVPLSSFTGVNGEKFQYNTTYQANITLGYSFPIGNGSTEMIYLSKVSDFNLVTQPHLDLDLSTLFICPTKVSIGGTIKASVWLCDAVRYQWKFEKTVNGVLQLVNGNPVTIEVLGPLGIRDFVPTASMGFTAGSEWRVQIRPIFANNVVGSYGSDYQCLIFKGTAAAMPTVENDGDLEKSLEMEVNDLSFITYPNPSYNGDLNLSWTVDENVESSQVQVLDQQGRLVYTMVLNDAGFATINAHEWEAGIYHIRLEQAGKTTVKRWMKI